MHEILLLSAALVIRTYVPTNGEVAVAIAPSERVVQAYSASFDNPWHHCDPATRTDRLDDARNGLVQGLANGQELVVSFVADDAAPDWTSPYSKGRKTFPYSGEFAAAFRAYGGCDYIAEMTEVAVPSYAGTGRRNAAVCAFHAALEKTRPGTFPVPVLTYGPEEGKRALVVVGHFRRFNPADRAYGLDGTEIAGRLSSAGMRTTVVSSARVGDVSVDDAGYIVHGGARVAFAVFAHLDAVDAAALRSVLGTRRLQTATFICDSPMVGHARILLPSADIDAQSRNLL